MANYTANVINTEQMCISSLHLWCDCRLQFHVHTPGSVNITIRNECSHRVSRITDWCLEWFKTEMHDKPMKTNYSHCCLTEGGIGHCEGCSCILILDWMNLYSCLLLLSVAKCHFRGFDANTTLWIKNSKTRTHLPTSKWDGSSTGHPHPPGAAGDSLTRLSLIFFY